MIDPEAPTTSIGVGRRAGQGALVEFRILGPLEVLDGDRPVHLPRGRGRALLALLVLRAGEVVSTDQLIDWLWGERPPRRRSRRFMASCPPSASAWSLHGAPAKLPPSWRPARRVTFWRSTAGRSMRTGSDDYLKKRQMRLP
jgi:hypothetical protein